ncbi:CxC2 domain-containing protein [Mycena kentingensis (nom. inval.)]|nr:CxC2 domain-containing protein [Mycena kentingensis (nom. inval.)]
MPPTRTHSTASATFKDACRKASSLRFAPRATRSGASFSPYELVLDGVDLDALYSQRMDGEAGLAASGDEDIAVLPGRALPKTEELPEDLDEQPSHTPSPPAPSLNDPQDEAMRRWQESFRDDYLEALLWLDGRGADVESTSCSRCRLHRPQYRCTECHSSGFLCKQCVLDTHAIFPFHWVEEWTGSFFAKISLGSLGLRVQLGHPVGESCSVPLAGPDDFHILHLNGIHPVAVDFCGCRAGGPVSFPLQLLHARLYPATTARPQTCATFACLDNFHSLSLHAKTSAYDYYASLELLTDGSGNKPPNRYKAFMRMARQFRHLLLLKRRGRGHAATGSAGTASGELALRCPACPRPGINLPDNWQDAAPADQCLYVIYLAMDACFRLKRRLLGGDLRDPGLGTGWAYFVEWWPYREYLKTITDQKEMSTCSGLAALDHANTKFSRGYSATGVGAGICARHEFVQPNGVGDLQRGERYGNMDYILASLLRYVDQRLRKVLSYDIACQWGKELKERLAKLPPLVRLNLILSLCRFVVPKMHILAHIFLCRLLFDLRLVPGSGQTDGEGIERLWSSIAGLAASSKLSGHGARADLLDDHWSFWNWCKTVGLPALLRRRLDNARIQLEKQEEALRVFSERQAEHVPAWLKMVEEFEADGSRPNPYASAQMDALSEKEVREQLEAEEREQAQKGAIPLHTVSPSEFMVFALELEDQQRHIRIQAALKRSKTTADKIRLKPLRRKLRKEHRSPPRLTGYIYSVGNRLPRDTHSRRPMSILKMFLSFFHPNFQMRCASAKAAKPPSWSWSARLRDAQCNDALVRLRSHLQVKKRLLIYKKRQSRHQGANTRSRGLISRNESKVKRFADQYQACWSALSVLEGSKLLWPQLHTKDIRGLEDADELTEREARNSRERERRLQRESELVASGLVTQEDLFREGEDDSMDEETVDMHTTAKKAGTGGGNTNYILDMDLGGSDGVRRRIGRWHVGRLLPTNTYLLILQVRILEEEWRRYPLSLAHEQRQWASRGAAAASLATSPETLDGLQAYAAKQASVYEQLIIRAEAVRTEEWKGRGHKQSRVSAKAGLDGGGAEAVGISGEDVEVPVEIPVDTNLGTRGVRNTAFLVGDEDDDDTEDDSDFDSDEDDEDEDDDEMDVSEDEDIFG